MHISMRESCIPLILFVSSLSHALANDVLGCGGFIKSHVQIDFSKVLVKLYTKNGILKDVTNCAPNNGYYFIPLYDKGEYILKLEPPPGWSFNPTEIGLYVDGHDLCSKGKDINFIFEGFGITGQVESLGTDGEGPSGVTVILKSGAEIRKTETGADGNFFFTPVYPGKYTVSITHPRWKILKGSVDVTVAEGNTDLGPRSLVIQGYDVMGYVQSDGEPIKGVMLALSQHDDYGGYAEAHDCDKSSLPEFKSLKILCHVISDANGAFNFASVTPGKYVITPLMRGQSIHFHPTSIAFFVQHGSVQLEDVFEVVGFNIGGRVLNTAGGQPFKGAKVLLNKKHVATTGETGNYILNKLKAGVHSLNAEADGVQFEEKVLKINPNMGQLPDLFPQKYRVCGIVVDDKSRTISFTSVDKQQKFTANTNGNMEFCVFLPAGRFNVAVVLRSEDIKSGVQFSSVADWVDVKTKPINGIVFSQLKATVSGKVHCIQEQDCHGLKAILTSIVKDTPIEGGEIFVAVSKKEYVFKDVRPGTYRVVLAANKLCWKADMHIISVKEETAQVPPFVQTGYSIAFVSTHDTSVKYRKGNKTVGLSIKKGKYNYCLDKPGRYDFEVGGCHIYENDKLTYDTQSENNHIDIVANKHRHNLIIESTQEVNDLMVTVTVAGADVQYGPLKHNNGKSYTLELFLSPGETAAIQPTSETLYFKPFKLSIVGDNDCVDLGVVFTGIKGLVFRGKVIPPLPDVLITLESDGSTLIAKTESSGTYKFPPQDESKNYRITATKDSFIFTGPDHDGNFQGHKLAEIVVQVIDVDTGYPLQGALLSLSGGESYRSNLQTNEDGKITFNSLTPSEYFLRPMMKEYSFEPSSKIIDVEEGVANTLLLKGKRVAYSVFGQVRSLNGEPEEGIIVIAAGVGNCSHFSEETSVELNGNFRIRGLQPFCSYEVTVNPDAENRNQIERITPQSVSILDVKEDVYNVKFVIFRKIKSADILLKVYTEDPEHYKSLRVKVTRESSPFTVIHNIKLDVGQIKPARDTNYGLLVQVPSVPLDGKIYSVQLKSSLQRAAFSKSEIRYFTSNSSFIYLELDFFLKTPVSEHHMKQTPLWTALFIITILAIIYNTEIFYEYFRNQLNKANLEGVLNKYKQKTVPTAHQMDPGDIDQIVQSINAVKRKPKPKKI